jgi:hypothetical protein
MSIYFPRMTYDRSHAKSDPPHPIAWPTIYRQDNQDCESTSHKSTDDGHIGRPCDKQAPFLLQATRKQDPY